MHSNGLYHDPGLHKIGARAKSAQPYLSVELITTLPSVIFSVYWGGPLEQRTGWILVYFKITSENMSCEVGRGVYGFVRKIWLFLDKRKTCHLE